MDNPGLVVGFPKLANRFNTYSRSKFLEQGICHCLIQAGLKAQQQITY
jgi:hypothetical protein